MLYQSGLIRQSGSWLCFAILLLQLLIHQERVTRTQAALFRFACHSLSHQRGGRDEQMYWITLVEPIIKYLNYLIKT